MNGRATATARMAAALVMLGSALGTACEAPTGTGVPGEEGGRGTDGPMLDSGSLGPAPREGLDGGNGTGLTRDDVPIECSTLAELVCGRRSQAEPPDGGFPADGGTPEDGGTPTTEVELCGDTTACQLVEVIIDTSPASCASALEATTDFPPCEASWCDILEARVCGAPAVDAGPACDEAPACTPARAVAETRDEAACADAVSDEVLFPECGG